MPLVHACVRVLALASLTLGGACSDAPSRSSAECTSDAQCACGERCDNGVCRGDADACIVADAEMAADVAVSFVPPSVGAVVDLHTMPADEQCWFAGLWRGALTVADESWLFLIEHNFCTTKIDRVIAYATTDHLDWRSEVVTSVDYNAEATYLGPSARGLANFISAAAGDGSLHVAYEARLGEQDMGMGRIYYASREATGTWAEHGSFGGEAIQAAQGTVPTTYGLAVSITGGIAYDPAAKLVSFIGHDNAWNTTRYNALTTTTAPGSAFPEPEVIQKLQGAIDRQAIIGSDHDYTEEAAVQVWIDKPGCALSGRTAGPDRRWGAIRTRPLGYAECRPESAAYYNFSADAQVLLTEAGPQVLVFVQNNSGLEREVIWLDGLDTEGARVSFDDPELGPHRAFVTSDGRLAVVKFDEGRRRLEVWFPETDELALLVETTHAVINVDVARHDPRFIAWVEATPDGPVLRAASFDHGNR